MAMNTTENTQQKLTTIPSVGFVPASKHIQTYLRLHGLCNGLSESSLTKKKYGAWSELFFK
jgi:hypothetical protein